MKKFKIIISILAIAVFVLLSLNTKYQILNTISAQSANCSPGEVARAIATALVSAPAVSGNLTTTGPCAVDPKTAFAPFKIPTYDDLKSLYFDQSKATKGTLTATLLPTTTFNGDIFHIAGNMDVGGTPTSDSGIKLIFVGGNLTFKSDYTYGSANSGTVFVVNGNVHIETGVFRIDAIIISQGKISTAGNFGSDCNSTTPILANQLIINGSLISLDETKPAVFCRTLTNNDDPAEKINHQVKYLVLLRNLMSDTYHKWSEIDASTIIPTP